MGRRWLRATGVGLAAVAASMLAVAGGGQAGAALSTTGGSCGFHLGPIQEEGAAGSAGLTVPVYPADPHQVCTVTVTAHASLTPASGGTYTDVHGNPSTTTITLAFTGSPLPLGPWWFWQPHCADPAAPGLFTVTMANQASTLPVGPDPCAEHGAGSSSLSFQNVPVDTATVVGMASTAGGQGYWTVSANGFINNLGDAPLLGEIGQPAQPPVGIVADPAGPGFWVAAADGGVFSFGDARFHGSLGGQRLAAPVVGMAATPDGGGYWLVAADGGVFSFGDARFHGSWAANAWPPRW